MSTQIRVIGGKHEYGSLTLDYYGVAEVTFCTGLIRSTYEDGRVEEFDPRMEFGDLLDMLTQFKKNHPFIRMWLKKKGGS